MIPVAILISGSGSNMEALVRSMTGDHPARAVVVVSNVPGAGGLDRAARLGIPAAVVDHRAAGSRAAFETVLAEALTPHKPDILCLAGFMRILSADFLAPWTGRCLNIHPSLLPKFRGLDTHDRAIAAGEEVHGCTVHEVTPALDDGPILGQARLRIAPGETATSLAARVRRLEHQLYPAVLRRRVEGDFAPLHLSES